MRAQSESITTLLPEETVAPSALAKESPTQSSLEKNSFLSRVIKKLQSEDSLPLVRVLPVLEYHKAIPDVDPSVIQERAQLLRENHYVKPALSLDQQASEVDRTRIFAYFPSCSLEKITSADTCPDIATATEYEGLNDLYNFLWDYIDYEKAAENPERSLISLASSLLENLTFIGEKEYQEAVLTIGESWKDYLRSNPGSRLVIWPGISPKQKWYAKTEHKSDAYMLDRVLSTFTNEEFAELSPRIKTSIDSIEPHEECRIILIDDWIVSGQQMRDSLCALIDEGVAPEILEKIEVNTIVTTVELSQLGLNVSAPFFWNSTYLPVYGYFLAHHSPETSSKEHDAHVTGIHSSVDFDFEYILKKLIDSRNYRRILEGQDMITLPRLANIVRDYRSAKLTHISKYGSVQRRK